MKKTILLTFGLISVLGCHNPKSPNGDSGTIYGDFNIKVIDSCEYLEYDYGVFDQRVYTLTHKGNCKNCNKKTTK